MTNRRLPCHPRPFGTQTVGVVTLGAMDGLLCLLFILLTVNRSLCFRSDGSRRGAVRVCVRSHTPVQCHNNYDCYASHLHTNEAMMKRVIVELSGAVS